MSIFVIDLILLNLIILHLLSCSHVVLWSLFLQKYEKVEKLKLIVENYFLLRLFTIELFVASNEP